MYRTEYNHAVLHLNCHTLSVMQAIYGHHFVHQTYLTNQRLASQLICENPHIRYSVNQAHHLQTIPKETENSFVCTKLISYNTKLIIQLIQ